MMTFRSPLGVVLAASCGLASIMGCDSKASDGGRDGGAAGSSGAPGKGGAGAATGDGGAAGSSGASGEGGAGAAAGFGGADPGLPKFPQFAPVPANRSVIDTGHDGEPILVSDPSVYADEEGYHLFFTAPFCSAAAGDDPTWLAARRETCATPAKGATGYAFSRDRGYTWELRDTPVVYPRADEWDSGDIECPFVFRLEDELVLLYGAFGPIVARFELGVARLTLGSATLREAMLEQKETFTQQEEQLIPADFIQPGAINNAQEPSAVVRADGVDVYYVAIGLTRPELGFEEGQAATGIELRRRSFDRSLTPIPNEDSVVLPGINIAEVYAVDGELELYSTSMEDTENHQYERILLHRSNDDGATWSGPTEVLGLNHDRFDNWGVMAPSLVMEEGRAVMFYTAWEYVDQPCEEISRSGMPDDEEDPEGSGRCLFATLGRAESVR